MVSDRFVAFAKGLNQQFRHGNRGEDCFGIRQAEPCKNPVGEGLVPDISFQLADEYAGVERDSAVTAQECAEGTQSQSARSFSR